jgi:glycosyltransferase involved in cell wall biosynthesis
MRSLGWRLTPPQGAARRAADAASTAAIAKALARRLGPDVTSVTVAQSLLPQLWRDGMLGGRSVAVLMTRLPIAVLQRRLDVVSQAHPDRATLSDYRADAWLGEAEAEALAAADEIVTPHAEIAALFGPRARLLDWRRPSPPPETPQRGDVFAFPGPTVARKGAFEVREASRRLGATLRPLGAELEGPDFWAGVRLDPAAPGASWLHGLRAVVHPALAEAAPRRLLEALAAGVPVIATAACGLAPQPGLTLVPMDDVEALVAAMGDLM